MIPDPFNPWPQRWQRLSATCVRAFHAYAGWLIGITWKRFVVLSVLLLISAGLVQNIPPFSWTYTTVRSVPVDDLPAIVIDNSGSPQSPPATPQPPAPPAEPGGSNRKGIHIETEPKGEKPGVNISIDDQGVRIVPHARPAQAASAPVPASNASAPSAAAAAGVTATNAGGIRITLPPNSAEGVREAVEEARQAIAEAVTTAREEAIAARDPADAAHAGQAASRAAADSSRQTRQAAAEARRALTTKEVHRVSLGEFLPSLAMLWIVASLIIKISYKRQVQAEAQAAQAVEAAESESLKRQVVEARMAAMQAQVEPHFLFNTLASIDHLIETDPKRASLMQKNLIALLRASMPSMREANGGTKGQSRDLGRELAVIRPYLEILKVRMEERLSTEIDVPEGLLSAEFPAMMLQTLVENAIKHGLEPKPEGGRLLLRAEIVHGKLAVSVSDTGLGFGRAATSGKTAGTGVGLANIRERLQLLHGNKATLTITENPGGGTRVTLAVPYKPVLGTSA